MFDDKLGYDPDEWEECPEQEHFLVFGFFTRFLLSAGAILFAYYFFKLVDENKNKGKKDDEEAVETAPSVTSNILEDASKKLQSVFSGAREEYRPPSSADALLQEADQYLKENIATGRDISPRRFVDAQISGEIGRDVAPQVEDAYNSRIKDERPAVPPHRDVEMTQLADRARDFPRLYEADKRNVDEEVQYMHQQIEQQMPGTLEPRIPPHLIQAEPSPTLSRGQDKDEAWDSVATGSDFVFQPTQSQVHPHPHMAPQTFQSFEGEVRKQPPLRRSLELSEGLDHLDQGFMPPQQFQEVFQTRAVPLQVDTQAKPSGSPKLSPKLSPRSQRELSIEEKKALQEWEWERAKLEADRLAKLQDKEVGGEESELSSSMAHLVPATHISYHTTSLPMGQSAEDKAMAGEMLQPERRAAGQTRNAVRVSDLTDYDISDLNMLDVQPSEEGPVAPVRRTTTNDSEEYVKVSAEPIYDEPPRADHPMTSEEARQLLELCQEYDFAADVTTPSHPQQYPGMPPPRPQPPMAPKPTEEPGRAGKETTTHVQFAPGRTEYPLEDFGFQRRPGEDPKNMAAAELFVQDALEYLNQQEAGPASGFVMEEEMLSSHGATAAAKKNTAPSGDPTSALVRTNDVFERVEHDEHDDMTYAPEIQSVEIPPDQLSENSENLLDYFDRQAAIASDLPQATAVAKTPSAPAMAPSIISASGQRAVSSSSLASGLSSDGYPRLRKQSSLLSVLGVTSMQEMLLTITSLESLTEAMRKAGLNSTNVIFGIDYTASNKYQGEDSFGGRSLHTIHPSLKNPYQQVISILGRTLSPFTSTGCFPVFGFGDARTGDWSVFPLKTGGHCATLEEVLKAYNEVTPNVDLSGPTNFAPLIHQAMEICQKSKDYHILVIIADGQVTNERATRRAIVQACQYPLSIIVVGVGDGPWDMMRVFDESLPKRPWDNFHFVEFNEIMKKTIGKSEGDVQFAVQSLLEIPDQFRCICELGLLGPRAPLPRGSEIRREMQT